MKKNHYISPETTVILVGTTAVIATSPGFLMMGGIAETEGNGAIVLSRRHGNTLWDEEWDGEEEW